MKEIKIGYWRSAEDKSLPMPKANAPGPNQAAMIRALKELPTSGEARRIGYRGSSVCRLCGKANGSQEFEIIVNRIKYRIPEGYVHYLEEHKVGYDKRLLDILDIC